MVGRCSEGDKPQNLREGQHSAHQVHAVGCMLPLGRGRYKCGVVPSTCVLHGNLTEMNMCYSMLNFSISSPPLSLHLPLSLSLSHPFSIPSHTHTNTSTLPVSELCCQQ